MPTHMHTCSCPGVCLAVQLVVLPNVFSLICLWLVVVHSGAVVVTSVAAVFTDMSTTQSGHCSFSMSV